MYQGQVTKTDTLENIVNLVANEMLPMKQALKQAKTVCSELTGDEFMRFFWPESKTLKRGFNTLKMGNLKLHKSIGIWNLPAIHSCPNCKDCAKTCYAYRPQRRWGDVRRSRFISWLLVEYHPEVFIKETVRMITVRKVKAVRIHESGDFYSKAYADLWIDIAKACPNTKFYFYTKVPENTVDLAKEPNVNQVESILPSGRVNYGKPERIERISAETGYPICPVTKHVEGIECGRNCQLCLNHKHVLFYEH